MNHMVGCQVTKILSCTSASYCKPDFIKLPSHLQSLTWCRGSFLEDRTLPVSYAPWTNDSQHLSLCPWILIPERERGREGRQREEDIFTYSIYSSLFIYTSQEWRFINMIVMWQLLPWKLPLPYGSVCYPYCCHLPGRCQHWVLQLQSVEPWKCICVLSVCFLDDEREMLPTL